MGRRERRQQKIRNTIKAAKSVLAFIPENEIKSIIQIGIGHWDEGELLLQKFPNRNWLGAEIIDRYCFEGKKKGFPGHIENKAIWSKTGKILKFRDRFDRSSLFVSSERFNRTIHEIETITLNDLVRREYLCIDSSLLWMDCEGAEVQVLQGADRVLPGVVYVIAEAIKNPSIDGYASESELVNVLKKNGFEEIGRFRHDIVFKQTRWS